jgi:hypothetical protein
VSLYPRAVRGQTVPPRTAMGLTKQLVGELGLCDPRPAAEGLRLARTSLLEASIDLSVHPADEEGGHAVHPGEVTSVSG